MNQAFIVRPFGTKSGVNFDQVEKDLIKPALKELGLEGETTGVIVEQGNIREDMFAQLLLADLVIADMSIHNANVFYELGVRHALRDKKTFLIRCSVPGHEVPFDLKTDRYLSYKADDPAAAKDALVAGLNATIHSDKVDSPVFFMLPKLEAQDPERFLPVPPDFGEEVELARSGGQIGKLALLAYEAEKFSWEMPALRTVAEALYQSNDTEAAGLFWERVRKRNPDDVEANDRLATTYQRLAESQLNKNRDAAWELLKKSDLAIDRVFKNIKDLGSDKKAELYALKGRNAKTRWIETWRKTAESEWRAEALRSTFLFDAYEDYERAYNEDLNHFYSGINTLGLLTVIISLAEGLPDIWRIEFATKQEASDKLKKHKARHKVLAVLVQAAIDAKRVRANPNDKPDMWLNITEADLACITSNKPQRIGGMYQKIIQEAGKLNFDSARRQLIIYQQLGVLPENIKAALAAFSKVEEADSKKNLHYILFTGHMLDREDRKDARFPASKEDSARAAIKEAVQREMEKYDNLKGIAGGASGGDILFHEVCEELGITTEFYLAFPRADFLKASVAFAGPKWIERFDRLYNKLQIRQLSDTTELPKWLQKNHKPDYIWERNNLWMLNSSLVCGGINMTMIALWNGEGGDGAGGTEHMVKAAEARGSKTVVIDINNLQ